MQNYDFEKKHISKPAKDGFDFDQCADNYKNIASDRVKLSGGNADYFAEYKVLELTKRLCKEKIDNILDIGCGIGLSSPFFIKHFPKSHLFGIDVSSRSIAIAKQNNNLKDVKYQFYNGTDFPFNDETFSVEFCSGVFHHIIDDELKICIISEAYRTLKQGGYFFIFEHNPNNIFTKIITANCPEDRAGKLVSINKMLKFIQVFKFQQVSVFNTLFFPRYKIFNHLFSLENHFYKLPFGAQYYVMLKK